MDTIEKLKELKGLLDEGVINESEFENLKKEYIKSDEVTIKMETKLTDNSTKRPNSIIIVAIILFLGFISSIFSFSTNYNELDLFTRFKYALSIPLYLWIGISLLKGDKYTRPTLNVLMIIEILYSIKALLSVSSNFITIADVLFILFLFGIPTIILILINNKKVSQWLEDNYFPNRKPLLYKVLPFYIILILLLSGDFSITSLHFYWGSLDGLSILLLPSIFFISFCIIFVSFNFEKRKQLSINLWNQSFFLLIGFFIISIIRFHSFIYQFVFFVLPVMMLLFFLHKQKIRFQIKYDIHSELIILSYLLFCEPIYNYWPEEGLNWTNLFVSIILTIFLIIKLKKNSEYYESIDNLIILSLIAFPLLKYLYAFILIWSEINIGLEIHNYVYHFVFIGLILRLGLIAKRESKKI